MSNAHPRITPASTTALNSKKYRRKAHTTHNAVITINKNFKLNRIESPSRFLTHNPSQLSEISNTILQSVVCNDHLLRSLHPICFHPLHPRSSASPRSLTLARSAPISSTPAAQRISCQTPQMTTNNTQAGQKQTANIPTKNPTNNPRPPRTSAPTTIGIPNPNTTTNTPFDCSR